VAVVSTTVNINSMSTTESYIYSSVSKSLIPVTSSSSIALTPCICATTDSLIPDYSLTAMSALCAVSAVSAVLVDSDDSYRILCSAIKIN
jgi:hypothetical protein